MADMQIVYRNFFYLKAVFTIMLCLLQIWMLSPQKLYVISFYLFSFHSFKFHFQLRKLPLSVIDGKKSDNVQPTNKHQDDMRIAWRYNNLDKIDSEQGNQNNNYYFDSSKHIPEEKITTLDTTICNGVDENNSFNENIRFTNQNYASILEQLKKKLQKDKFKWSNDGEKNVLRILIQSLGSPLWWNDKFSSDLCLFLLILKSIVKHSSAVCCITVPSHLFQHFVILRH